MIVRTLKKSRTRDFRFDTDDERSAGPKSIFCMPIRDPDDKVLGVISLIDKDNVGEFTDNDARCAMTTP